MEVANAFCASQPFGQQHMNASSDDTTDRTILRCSFTLFSLFSPIFAIPRDGDNDLHFPTDIPQRRIVESSPHFLALHIFRLNLRFPVEHACMSRRAPRARTDNADRPAGEPTADPISRFKRAGESFNVAARECQSTSIPYCHDIYILLTTTTDGTATNLLQPLLQFAVCGVAQRLECH